MSTEPKLLSAPMEDEEAKQAILRALDQLPEREGKVMRMRYGIGEDHEMTLDECGKRMKVTRERVRQIEVRAFEKVQKAVKNGVAKTESWAALVH
jgi:RNA polymerase sigma factor (sigma-70 family)